jgi:signal peptidase I
MSTTTRTVERTALRHWSRLVAATAARVVLYSLGGMLLFAAAPAVVGWVPTTVMSDSMAPSLRAGDVVVAMPVEPTAVRLGQILLFADPDHPERKRLHRFIEMTDDGLLLTKGDANPEADSTPAVSTSVIGAGVLRIPYVGMVTTWMANRQYLPVAIVVMAIIGIVILTRIDRYLLYPRPGEAPVEGLPRHRGRYQAKGVGRVVNGGSAMAVLALTVASVMVMSSASHAAFTRSTSATLGNLQSSATFACLTKTVADSPWFYYGYNELTGTTATDWSGSNRTATLTAGVSRVAGSCVKNASPYVTLDGTSGEVGNSPAVLSIANTTYETWIKTTTTTGGNIMSIGNAATGLSTNHDRHLYMADNGKVIFASGSLGGIQGVTSPTALNDGLWHHLVATGTLGQVKLYVDGTLVGTNSNVFLTLGGNIRIGYDSLSGGYTSVPTSLRFKGSLDNTAFYTAQLTDAQAAAHYAVGH